MDNFRLIKNSKYIYTIMKRFSRKDDNSAIINIGNNSFTAKLLIDYKNRKISFKNDINLITSSEDKVDITFHVRNSLLKARLGIVSIDDEVELEYPDEIFIGHRRQSSRHRVNPNSEVYLFDDNLKRVMIYDISKNGLSFYTKDTLEVNREINNYKLIISGKEIFINGEIIQRRNYNDSNLYAVVFKDINEEDKESIFNFIFRDLFPNIKYWWECKEEDIYHIFKESGYLDFIEKNEIHKSWNNLMSVRKDVLKGKAIFADFLYYKNQPVTCASFLKVYNKTYLAQHLATVSKSTEKIKALKQIYSASQHWLIESDKCKYFLTYFINEKWHERMYVSLIELINDKNNTNYDYMKRFKTVICKTRFYNTNIFVRECKDNEDFMKFFSENYSKLEAEVYSYNNDFFLSEMNKVYKNIGLNIERVLLEVLYNNSCIGYIVAETYTSGLNICNALDGCRIYLLRKYYDMINETVKTMIPVVNKLYEKYGKYSYSIFVNSENSSSLSTNIDGVELEMELGRLMSTRKGFGNYNRIYEFIM